MDAQELLHKYGLDAPPAHEEFIRQLRNLPLDAPKWLYSAARPSELVQGDVVGPVHYVAVSEENQRAVIEGDVMVVSNTCDMVPDQSPFALVAPVIELELYTTPETTPEDSWMNHLRALRKFEVGPYYYLPSWEGFDESFADFSRITHLPSKYLVGLIENGQSARKISLSQKGHLLLLSKLAYFFVRLETDQITRQSGN